MLVKKIDSACRATHRRYNWHSSRIVTFAANRVLTASDESNPDDIRRIRRRTALDSTTLRYPTQLCRAVSWRLDHSVPSTRNVGVQLRRKPYDAHTGSRPGREKRKGGPRNNGTSAAIFAGEGFRTHADGTRWQVS